MNLPSLSIKKPVLAGVFSALIVILGLVGWRYLGIREFPLTEPPVISVITFYPGASPDVIASKITKPLEESIAEANGSSVEGLGGTVLIALRTPQIMLATLRAWRNIRQPARV